MLERTHETGAGVAAARLPIDDVYVALASRSTGLTAQEVAERRAVAGPNVLPRVAGPSLMRRLLANFTHVMALLLWAGGIVGFIAGMPELGIAIWLVNIINGAFSFWQEYKAEKAVEALARLLPARAHVVRDGEDRQVDASDVVPGDVLLLAEGEHVPADARLVEASELRTDQSTLTGEAHPVRKSADPVLDVGLAETDLVDLVFAGTNVVAGTGRAVTVATGAGTAFGRIAYLTQSMGETLSPLQRELAIATRIVTVLAVGMGALLFVISALFAHIEPAASFIFAMGMVVAFVPEGMLPLVTLSLAMATQRMAGRNALVKRLSAVETLGCTTVICTDKTGTLTQNEMTVRRIWLPDGEFEVSGVGYVADGELTALQTSTDATTDGLHDLLRAAALCNDARIVPPAADTDDPRWTVLGDPTEAALRVVALKGGVDPEAEARARPRVRELPFDSRRKRMTTLHLPAAGGPRRRPIPAASARTELTAYVKGAPREILALCTHVRAGDRVIPLDDAGRSRAMEANDEAATAGLRVLALARRDLSIAPADATPESVETDLVFLGLAAMHDPPRPEVAAAIATCHRAGIRVVMITGDYGLTAESIARRIGIIGRRDVRLITGTEIDGMTDEDLRASFDAEVLFARVSPEHKLRIVTELQHQGHVVAVTGDGVNDAPALKKADIGVAMGIAGSDVAKEAGDMILTDDNFASIVSAIEEGRGVYAAIRKFVGYIFTSNAPEIWPFILFALSGGRIPVALPVMQVLAIDLGTDMAPALALGAEPPEPGIMDRPPRSLHDHVLTRALLVRSLLYLGTIQSIAALAAFFLFFWTNGYPGQVLDLPADGTIYAAATAMTFSCIVMTQIGNLFAHRTERVSILRLGRHRMLANRLVWVGIATEVAVMLILVYTSFGNAVIGTAPIPSQYWPFLIAWIPSLLIADELRKALVRRRERRDRRHGTASTPIHRGIGPTRGVA